MFKYGFRQHYHISKSKTHLFFQ
uniref:Uncharacterized protein n=1 Tax=Anguilla anguilla TaxID=7936 RepID=A0A0E9P531_ANGAN